MVELSDVFRDQCSQNLYVTTLVLIDVVRSSTMYRCTTHLHVQLPGNCSKMEIMKLRSTKTAPPKINSREDPNLQFRASRNQDPTTTKILLNQLEYDS